MLPFVNVVSVPGVRGMVGQSLCCHHILLHSTLCSLLRKTEKLHYRSGQGHTDSVLCHYVHARGEERQTSGSLICSVCLAYS